MPQLSREVIAESPVVLPTAKGDYASKMKNKKGHYASITKNKKQKEVNMKNV